MFQVNNCLLKLFYLSVAAAQNFLYLQGFNLPNCFALLLEKWKTEFQDVLDYKHDQKHTNTAISNTPPFIKFIIFFLEENVSLLDYTKGA